MLEEFCAAEPAPTRDWLATERARVAAGIGAAGQAPPRHVIGFRWPTPSRSVLAGAVAVAAVGALVAALVVPSGPGAASPQPRTQTAAYVISHTEAALSVPASGNWVVHVRTSLAGRGRMVLDFGSKNSLTAQREDTWYHGPDSNGPSRTQGFGAAGQPVFDSSVVQAPYLYTTTLVDYPARVWWRNAQHVTRYIPTPAAQLTCGEVNDFAGTYDPTYWAADIHKALSCGQYTTAGTEEVDGADAIKLTPVRPGLMASVLWVNPSTFLPVRVEGEFQGRLDGETQDVTWLPPTTANLGQLTAPIPPGFVQVPPPPACRAAGLKGIATCSSASSAWYTKYVAPRM